MKLFDDLIEKSAELRDQAVRVAGEAFEQSKVVAGEAMDKGKKKMSEISLKADLSKAQKIWAHLFMQCTNPAKRTRSF